jgi:hypothetical protein
MIDRNKLSNSYAGLDAMIVSIGAALVINQIIERELCIIKKFSSSRDCSNYNS